MINIDESELIDFFEVLPAKEPKEEKEFFGSLQFDVYSSGYHLSFNVSSHFADLYVELKKDSDEEPVASIIMKDIKEFEIVRDKQNKPPFLRACCTASQSIEIRTKPRLIVKTIIE